MRSVVLLALGALSGCAHLIPPPPPAGDGRADVVDARAFCADDQPMATTTALAMPGDGQDVQPPLDEEAHLRIAAAVRAYYGEGWERRFRVTVRLDHGMASWRAGALGARAYGTAVVEVRVRRVADGSELLHARGRAFVPSPGAVDLRSYHEALFEAVADALHTRRLPIEQPPVTCETRAPHYSGRDDPRHAPPSQRWVSLMMGADYTPSLSSDRFAQGGALEGLARYRDWELFIGGYLRQGRPLGVGESLDVLAYVGGHALWPLTDALTVYAGGAVGGGLMVYHERSSDFRASCADEREPASCPAGMGRGALSSVRREQVVVMAEVGARADLLLDHWIFGPYVELGADLVVPSSDAEVRFFDGGDGAAARTAALRAQLDAAGARLGWRFSAGLIIGY